MKRLTLSSAVLAAALGAGSATAEDQGYRPGGYGVPSGHLPSPGQCRVWYPGRPPGQQPPPVDCARAQYDANRYGGQVIYGGEPQGRRWDGDRRDRGADRDRRGERDGDDAWVRVCTARDWQGRCVRSEVRRR